MAINRTIFVNRILTLEMLKAGIFSVKRIKLDPTTKKIPKLRVEIGAKLRKISWGVEVNNSTNIIRR
jgi:hypothetical protein